MKLLNCVKCGFNAYMVMSIRNYCVRCEACDNHGEWKETDIEAAKNWNMQNNETTAKATMKDKEIEFD